MREVAETRGITCGLSALIRIRKLIRISGLRDFREKLSRGELPPLACSLSRRLGQALGRRLEWRRGRTSGRPLTPAGWEHGGRAQGVTASVRGSPSLGDPPAGGDEPVTSRRTGEKRQNRCPPRALRKRPCGASVRVETVHTNTSRTPVRRSAPCPVPHGLPGRARQPLPGAEPLEGPTRPTAPAPPPTDERPRRAGADPRLRRPRRHAGRRARTLQRLGPGTVDRRRRTAGLQLKENSITKSTKAPPRTPRSFVLFVRPWRPW